MGKSKLTGADAVVGKLSSKGNISAASGAITASGRVGSTHGVVSANSAGFCVSVASVSLKRARVAVSVATTGERTYALDFAAGDVIKNVYLDVATAEATASDKTIDVGLLSSQAQGDSDGFLDGAGTATAAIVPGSLVAGSVTRGALLSEGTAASGRFAKYHVVHSTAAFTLSSKVAEVQTELVADIIVEYETIA